MYKKYITLIVISFITSTLIYKYYCDWKRDQAISQISSKLSDSQRFCVSENIENRISCLNPKLKKISNQEINSKDFFFIKKNKKIKLQIEILENYIKIPRISEMTFGGKCVSTFFFSDFDDKFLYLSKDNLTGLFFCKNNLDSYIITSGELSEEKIKNDLRLLLGSSLP